MELQFLKGKTFEGIDFADNAANWVIEIGIPYASRKSLKILFRKDS